MMTKQGGIKDLSKGRSDQYRLSPYDLHTKDGWNVRENDFDDKDADDLALAQSIAEIGVKQALTAYWEDGKAFVSDGHRRRAAAIYAIENLGADREMVVPVTTEHRTADEAERVFSMIVRNSGKPLSPLEQGQVYARLTALGWTDSNIAKKAGISRVHVANLIALVAAPKTLTNLVREGSVSATLAITTLNKHKGEARAAAKELKAAVKTAKKEGKARATAKHTRKAAAPKIGPLDELKAILTAHPVTFPDSLSIPDVDDLCLIPVTWAQLGRVREIFGIPVPTPPARPADDLV